MTGVVIRPVGALGMPDSEPQSTGTVLAFVRRVIVGLTRPS